MPSGSSAALALAAAPAPLPQPPPLPPPAGGPELEGDGLLLRERLAALGLDDPSPAEPGAPALRAAAAAAQCQARRAAGLAPEEPAPPGRLATSEPAELEVDEEEEGEEAELDGELLEEEELEEAEEEDRPSLLLLSPPAATASQTQPIPGGPLGSVLLPAAGFDAREAAAAAAAGVLYGGDDAQGMMAAMLSHAYGPGGGGGAAAAAALNGEQAALLRRKSVNTTECVPVPSSEHVAEIVGRQGECAEVCLGTALGVGGRRGKRKNKKKSVRRKSEPGESLQVHREGVWDEPRVAEKGTGHLAKPQAKQFRTRSVKFLGPPSLVVFTGIGVFVEHQAGAAPETSVRWEGQVRSCGLRSRFRKLRDWKFV